MEGTQIVEGQDLTEVETSSQNGPLGTSKASSKLTISWPNNDHSV